MSIQNFVNEHKVNEENKNNFTHGSMKPAGSYLIDPKKMDTFYELYEEAIFSGQDLHLLERHEEFGPVLVDLDFKYDLEVKNRVHTQEHIKKIVQLYIDEICEVFDVSKDSNNLDCFVFERDNAYQTNTNTKDGIHMIFPFIVSYPNAQFHIRDNILKKIMDILNDLGLKETAGKIVDRSVIFSNNWFLYGSKKPGLEPYKLKYIFNGLCEKIELGDYPFPDTNLVRFLSIRGRKSYQLSPIKVEKIELLETCNIKVKPKKNLKSIINYDAEQIKKLVNILKDERADDYTKWLEVGWALHNIDPNSQDLLNTWVDFSRKSPKFEEGRCEKEWESSKIEGLSIGSLHHWAKEDNYVEYRKIMDEDINKDIETTSENPNQYDIAKILYKMYKYDFKWTGFDWYIFKNHIWTKENDGMSLRSKISNELCEKYSRMIANYNKIRTNPSISEEEKEEYKKKSKFITAIVNNLKSTAFKENIMKECKELFKDSLFTEKLDENPYLIGFNNGIFDLLTGQLRDGRPDDYMEMTTGIDKLPFDENNENWADLKHFLHTVFVSEEIRDYFLTYFASCLQGVNEEEKFRIWTGVGSNGKSKILELFVHCLGAYAIKFPITLLTGKRAQSNACTPEVVQSKGKRFAYCEEPSEDEKINVGLLKEYTGNDKIKARGLHKEPIEFKPQFKLALLCNDIPKVPPHDTGAWRRIEIIEFKSRFCDDPKESNEFPIDKLLSVKMKKWKELFMSLLLDVYYAKYRVHKIKKVPDEIKNFTLDFKKQSDLYIDFICDNIEDTKNIKDDLINLNDLYDEFKIWYEDAFGNHKYPPKTEFKKYLIKNYTSKRVSSKEIKGFKFKSKICKNEVEEKNIDENNFSKSLFSNEFVDHKIENNIEIEFVSNTDANDDIHLNISELEKYKKIAKSKNKKIFVNGIEIGY